MHLADFLMGPTYISYKNHKSNGSMIFYHVSVHTALPGEGNMQAYYILLSNCGEYLEFPS